MTQREIGLRMTRLREARGLTVVTLGRKSGLSQAQISRLENGKEGLRSATMAKLGDALGVPGFYFLMSDEEWRCFQDGCRARGVSVVDVRLDHEGA